MKKCTRFHIEDVERGDVLVLIPDVDAEVDDPGPIQITVDRVFRTNNFGWVITSQGDGPKSNYYLDDYDDVSLVSPPEPSAAAS